MVARIKLKITTRNSQRRKGGKLIKRLECNEGISYSIISPMTSRKKHKDNIQLPSQPKKKKKKKREKKR